MSEKKQRKVKAQVPVPGEALWSCGSLQPLPRGFNPQPRAGAGRCDTRTSPSKNTDGQQRSLNPGGKCDGNLAQGGPRGGQGRHRPSRWRAWALLLLCWSAQAQRCHGCSRGTPRGEEPTAPSSSHSTPAAPVLCSVGMPGAAALLGGRWVAGDTLSPRSRLLSHGGVSEPRLPSPEPLSLPTAELLRASRRERSGQQASGAAPVGKRAPSKGTGLFTAWFMLIP